MKDHVLFEKGPEGMRYLHAVDKIRCSVTSDSLCESSSEMESKIQLIDMAMVRLESEFRHMLASTIVPIDFFQAINKIVESVDSDMSRTNDQIIRQVLISIDMQDIRSVADCMIGSGYGKRCIKVYGGMRKPKVFQELLNMDTRFLAFGESFNVLVSDLLAQRVRCWIRSGIRLLINAERQLSKLVFGEGVSGIGIDCAAFTKAVEQLAEMLFSLADVIGFCWPDWSASVEKICFILELYHTIEEIMPLHCSNSVDERRSLTIKGLAKAAIGSLLQLESKIFDSYPLRSLVPGGAIHPMTMEIMGTIVLLSRYKETLAVVVSKSEKLTVAQCSLDQYFLPLRAEFLNSRLPLTSHFISVVEVLQERLENSSKMYKEAALSKLFMINNVHYISGKLKETVELKDLVGMKYVHLMEKNYNGLALEYVQTSLADIVPILRSEGMYENGRISKVTLKHRLSSFNSAFEEIKRTQGAWCVPDLELRNKLRLMTSQNVVQAYRYFVQLYHANIDAMTHPKKYMKYHVEDIQAAFLLLLEGEANSK